MSRIYFYFRQYLIFFTLQLISVSLTLAQSPDNIKTETVSLPNGWKLTPVGKMLPLGDLPLNIAVSSSHKLLAVTNNGQSTQSVILIDAVNWKILDSVVMAKSWLGLTFSSDNKYLYASGGNDNWIVRYLIRNRKLVPEDTFAIDKPWPVEISVAGIAVDDTKQLLYAVTKEDNALYVYDLKNKKVVSRHSLGGEGYTCLLSPDRNELYITCWGCDRVEIFDTRSGNFSAYIPVGDNPNDMCITRNGRNLFVANANDNSVSVIDLKLRKVIETLNAAMYPNSPEGSTTNSVALSADDKDLYVANADNNCLAVFDVSSPGNAKSKGFIPTGWYPTCVRIVGEKIVVSNGKGNMSMANPYGPNPYRKGEEVVYQHGEKLDKMHVQYIAGLFKGTLQVLDTPKAQLLGTYSKIVYQNSPYLPDSFTHAAIPAGNPVPGRLGDTSPIKHVFYIIKENRTYDQVLGDMPEGNGDTSLVLFGEHITPNQHALAREFVLFDNFYVDGEVSADGHNWSMGAYATDYLEKTWPTSYGNRGGKYDAEGNRDIANNKNGFLWNTCKKYGVSYRTYGEFMHSDKPNIPVLENHYCPYFTSWDETVRDTVRFRQWKRDFDSLLAIHAVPQLSTLHIINDHTEGLNLGRPTPDAHVADNDLAVGLFVDYLSHSPIWNESVVFIVEDDAQNGPDHVDAHRSTVYVAGGFVKKNYVDHSMYTTSSILRTIELILGLPPMSQYDASAVPMWRCFNSVADHPPFVVKPCQVDLNQINTEDSKYARISEQFDFSKEDRAPDQPFNEVIWKAVKGLDSKCPPPVHAAFFVSGADED